MKKIIILAESGSDVNKELAKQYDVTIVPMHVQFGDETLDDGLFPVEKIVNYYSSTGKLPKTSGSTPNDFEVILDELHEKYPEAHILYLAYSAVTTCSFQSCVIASTNRDYVTMLDTKQVSLGQGAIVMQVAKKLQDNPDITLDELVNYAKELVDTAHMCFLPNDLEFLRAGGRVSNAAYMGAKILNLHPVIEIIDGKLTATKKYRGKLSRVASKMLKEYTELYGFKKSCLWMIHTLDLQDEVKDALNATAKELGYESIVWVQANGVITTHAGPSAVGFVGFN